MPGYVLDSTCALSCFHQAPAQLTPAPRVLVNGSPVATLPTASPKIVVPPGCPFQVPIGTGTKPQPCVTITWANPSTRVTVMGQALLLQAGPGPGNGMCQSAEQIPQGAPTFKKMQTRVLAS